MRIFLPLVAVTGLLLVGAACTTTPAPAPVSQFRAGITIQDIMESVIDPSADALWDSVSTNVSAKGIEEKAPKTDEDWREVRRHAIILMEASNLLKIPGRQVARPGTKSTAPGIEEEPEGTKKLMEADQVNWTKSADALHDAAALLLKAADDRSSEGILDAGNTLDQACEACHLTYWYPNQTEILRKNAAERGEPKAQ